jgi:aldehyde dehydrogenase (NAD+)
MAMPQAIEAVRHPYANGEVKRMLINGEWVRAASGKTFESRNPATGDLLATVAEGDKEDIDRAVAAARAAFEGPWSKFKPYERQPLLLKIADLVEKHYDELSLLDTLDMGAPVTRTRGTKQRVLGMLRWYAGMATAIHGETIENSLPGEFFSYTLKEPIGVVGAIIPWNGPLGASIWKIGPALATGCTVILKPAEEAPLTPLRLGELLMDAGVPPEVVNIVPGYGETAGAALAAHPGVDKVAFTGSHLTGQLIVQASAGNLKRVSLELGANRPTSSLPTPTSKARCRAPAWRCLPIRDRSAAPGLGFLSSARSTTNLSAESPISARRSRSATASIPIPKLARSSPSSSWSASPAISMLPARRGRGRLSAASN